MAQEKEEVSGFFHFLTKEALGSSSVSIPTMAMGVTRELEPEAGIIKPVEDEEGGSTTKLVL